MTPKQRTKRLLLGRDLDGLTVRCYNQKSISTKIVLAELRFIKRQLRDHGRALR